MLAWAAGSRWILLSNRPWSKPKCPFTGPITTGPAVSVSSPSVERVTHAFLGTVRIMDNST